MITFKTQRQVSFEEAKEITRQWLELRYKLGEWGYVNEEGNYIETLDDLHNKPLEINRGKAPEEKHAAKVILKDIYGRK